MFESKISWLCSHPPLMTKFDTMQAKHTYGSTQIHMIPMNKKPTLTMTVYSTFRKNQTTNQAQWYSTKTQFTSYFQQQNNLRCHVLCSIIWNLFRFYQWKICHAPSQWPAWNGPYLRSQKNSISQQCHQWYHHWYICTTQIQIYGHALLLASWLMPKTFHVHWKQIKHNLANYPPKHNSTKHHI